MPSTTPDAFPSEGLRDTNEFYGDGDPLRWVDRSLVAEIEKRCGRSLLDLGCGAGGYSRVLMDNGYAVQALDINAAYVDKARALGVDARRFDGSTIPLESASVDTVFMIEVLEHVREPASLVAEAARVARRNVILSVPNNTQKLNDLFAWSHMLDVDHKNFFTVDSLGRLLRERFADVTVEQIAPADHLIARDLLGNLGYVLYRGAAAIGLRKPRFFFRLLAEAKK